MYGGVPPLSTHPHGSFDRLRDYHILRNAATLCRIRANDVTYVWWQPQKVG